MNDTESYETTTGPKLVCPICKKTVDGLYPYHDRKNYYSGRACSDQCAQSLPGQGHMWNYEPEHGEDNDDD